MVFEFKLPDIGEGVIEGEIVKWLVRPGEAVREDQPMVEVMTDKATVVIPSPKAGTIVELRGAEGGIAKVHETLVLIELEGASAARADTRPAPRPEAIAPAPARPADGPVLAAPATRRLARELGVTLSALSGTGPEGRVTSADVKRAAAHAAPTTAHVPVLTAPPPAPTQPLPAGPAGAAEVVPARGMRKRIWESMARSKSLAAHFTFVEECDVSELVTFRDRANQRLGGGEPALSYLPFIVKAVISGLKRFPMLNGHVDEEKMAFVERRDYHVGIAVATERGLIVPVLRSADHRSLKDISKEIGRLADAARAGKITSEDLGGSTFTITSLGKQGGIFATPIINHPEVAIMGVHRMIKRPIVDDQDRIVVRTMMNLSLSFDHRLIDGHVGAAFTYHVIGLLESPERLMMELS